MLSAHVREPMRDIQAQIAALIDPQHPKKAVFLAPGNLPDHLPDVLAIHRPEGTLLTENEALAHLYRSANPLTDDLMAEILGYPEPKSSVCFDPYPLVVQALDMNGCVITEAASSHAHSAETITELQRHVPKGGRLNITTLTDALNRRITEI